jgi:branched-chain amino acid transport system permease protein
LSTPPVTLPDRARALTPSPAEVGTASLLPIVVMIAATLAMHFAVGPFVGDYYTKVLLDIGINIILAVSLNLVNGFTGQFSIGHAGFMAVGGYTAGAITYYGGYKLWGGPGPHGGFLGAGEMLFVGGIVAGALVAAMFGYLVGLPSLRLRGDYLAIVTLGFGEIVRVLLQQTDDVVFVAKDVEATPVPALVLKLGGALGFTGIPFYTNLFWVYLFVGLTVLIAYRLKLSTHGRAFLAIREDEIAADAMGIPTTTIKVRAFVLSAALAGVAGALFAHEVGTTLNPRELGFQKSFEVVIMVVLGGMGSISGCVLAAIVLTVLPELLRSVAEYRMIAYALVLIIMMLVRPQGLFGLHEIWDLATIHSKPKKERK